MGGDIVMNEMKRKRLSSRLTQLQLAKMIGTDRTTVTKIENDYSFPSIHTAKKIARVLNFDWTLFYKDIE